MIRTIYLHHSLEKLVDGPLQFAANDIDELIRYLRLSVPGFWHQFKQLDRVCFIRKTGDKASTIEKDELNWRLGDAEEIHVCPVIEGAGIEVGTAAWYAMNFVISMAVSYAVSYILQSMQETPETEDLKPEQASTIFNGGKTLDKQGQRVPLAYGKCMVNGARVNINYEAVDASLGQSDYITFDEGSSATLNVFTNDKNLVSPVVVNFTINGTQKLAGETYSGFGNSVSGTVAANGQLTLNSTTGAGGSEFVVEVYATDNGLSIPQKVYVTINSVIDPNAQGGGGGDSSDGI